MGGKESKIKRKSVSDSNIHVKTSYQMQVQKKSAVKYMNEESQTTGNFVEDIKLAKLRWTLHKDTDMFLLNNILMITQFFYNFDKEVAMCRTEAHSDLEQDLNKRLEAHGRRCIVPDPIIEMVSKQVNFENTYKCERTQTLAGIWIFIINHNVTVYQKSSEPQTKTKSDKYRFIAVPTQKQGNIKLQYMGTFKDIERHGQNKIHKKDPKHYSSDLQKDQKYTQRTDTLSMTIKEDEKIQMEESTKITHSVKSVISSNKSSARSSKSSSSGYKSKTSLNSNTETTKLKPLEECRMGTVPYNSYHIPTQCFVSDVVSHVKFESPFGNDYESEEIHSDLFETYYFLNPKSYMAYFIDVFVEKLCSDLKFTKEIILRSTVQGSSIYCTKIHGKRLGKCCILPGLLQKEWPQQATEWLMRKRIWPNAETIEAVHQMGCILLPSITNENRAEWKLTFPESERILLLSLNEEQIRCYIFVLTLFKSYFKDTGYGKILTSKHIQNILFWLCELDKLNCSYDELGEAVRTFTDTIIQTFETDTLYDYFLRTRNLYINIPKSDLRRIHARLHRIKENLTYWFLNALENLHYNDTTFFPKFDVQALKDILLNMCNGTTMTKTSGIDRWWTEIDSEGSVEVIQNEEMNMSKNLNRKQRTALLQLFANYFVDIAMQYMKYTNYQRSYCYIQHSERLATLLSEEMQGQRVNKYLFAKIKSAKENIQQKLMTAGHT